MKTPDLDSLARQMDASPAFAEFVRENATPRALELLAKYRAVRCPWWRRVYRSIVQILHRALGRT